MRIIPVLDILTLEEKKHVVRGIKGERKKYFPIKSSKILNDSNPIEMAKKFKELGEFEELYIADLDAIQGLNRNLDYINVIVQNNNQKVMVDAGISNLSDINNLKKINIDKFIIGTETLKSLQELKDIIDIFGNEKIILSIDLFNNRLMTKNEELKDLKLKNFLNKIMKLDIQEIIFLELTQVGAKTGVNASLIKLMRKYLNCKLITGGGVKTISDLMSMQELGIDGVLVATALHEGTITIKQINNFICES